MMHPALERLEKLCDELIAKKPKRRQTPAYDLPQGTWREGDLVTVPGSRKGDVWHVNLEDGTCDCPAFRFRSRRSCKHVLAARAIGGEVA